MIVKDWAQEAADEINAAGSSDDLDKWAPGIIRKHSPFKDGVAYMPVPRCETCKHYDPQGRITVTTSPFTSALKPKCLYLNIPTIPDFGCVQWEKK